MALYNRLVAAVLQSPIHRVLSGSTDLVRYRGRRSGRVFTTPTQYVRRGDEVIILVGDPWRKKWWRNFEPGRELELLLAGEWVTMLARAHVGSDDPELVRPLVRAFLERFPRAEKGLEGKNEGERVRNVVVVLCRPPAKQVNHSSTSASKGA